LALAPGASPALAQTLMRRLQEWTGRRWMVAISNEAGAPTLHERREAQAAEARKGVEQIPLVQKVLEHFPGAKIVKQPEAALPEPASETSDQDDADEAYLDEAYTEDDL
jgi:DNA polymerase-3 subunit gamma/tau